MTKADAEGGTPEIDHEAFTAYDEEGDAMLVIDIEFARELWKQLAAANRRIAELETALKFYADPSMWESHGVSGGGDTGPVVYECPIGEDGGDIARKAIAELEGGRDGKSDQTL